MGELRIFYQDTKKIKIAKTLDILNQIDKKNIIWIDLLDVAESVESQLEDFLKIYIQEDEEMEEIEMSSRYIQTDDSIVANSNFLKNNFLYRHTRQKNGIFLLLFFAHLKNLLHKLKHLQNYISLKNN